jgi:hypothetical protein
MVLRAKWRAAANRRIIFGVPCMEKSKKTFALRSSFRIKVKQAMQFQANQTSCCAIDSSKA